MNFEVGLSALFSDFRQFCCQILFEIFPEKIVLFANAHIHLRFVLTTKTYITSQKLILVKLTQGLHIATKWLHGMRFLIRALFVLVYSEIVKVPPVLLHLIAMWTCWRLAVRRILVSLIWNHSSYCKKNIGRSAVDVPGQLFLLLGGDLSWPNHFSDLTPCNLFSGVI